MAFRASKTTLGLLVMALALYVSALVLDKWMTYDFGLRADVGLLQYHIKNTEPGLWQSSTHSMLTTNCDNHLAFDAHDRKECKIWLRIAGAVLGLICLACLSLTLALFNVAVGTGTKMHPFMLSLLFALAALIVFLAGHERVRIPWETRSVAPEDVDNISSQPDSVSPDVTLGPAFAIYVIGCAFNIASIGYHLTVCNMRKFEEL
ncbi:hypothetical protein DIPPA_21909 [Diplonema papillatum]|nr:hypothetical protein DIPPA_21909 [Diplonema papillatum]